MSLGRLYLKICGWQVKPFSEYAFMHFWAGRKALPATNKTWNFLVFVPMVTVHDLEIYEVALEVIVLAE